jgi:preprotein translocase subunit SecB
MKLAPLQLTDYFLTHLLVDSNPEFNSAKPADDPVDTLTVVPGCSLSSHKGEQGTEWLVSLEITQTILEGANLPYSFSLRMYGFVLASPHLECAKIERIVHANGPAMLFGAAREIIRAATGRGPWPAVIIPSTNFLTGLPPLEVPAKFQEVEATKVKEEDYPENRPQTKKTEKTMTHFLAYWTFANANYTDESNDGLLLHAASNQYGRLTEGDTVWFVTSKDHRFYLLGPILVDEITDTEEAEARLDSEDLYSADYHILAADGAAAKMKWVDVTDDLPKLRFSGTKNDRLPASWGPGNLQTMRKLTEASGKILRSIYDMAKTV